MNEIDQKVIDSIRNISLSKDEKEAIWKHVDAYVKEHGVSEHPRTAQSFRPTRRILSPYMVVFERAAVFALVALVIFGGGTSLLAQSALPNDALYPVKLTTESVRSWLALTSEAKAHVETQRAIKRVEEARTLALRGELNAVSKQKIQENFNKHVQIVFKQVAALEAKDDLRIAVDVSKNFETLLAEEGKSLVKIAQSDVPASAAVAMMTVAEESVDSAVALKARIAEPVQMAVVVDDALAPIAHEEISQIVDSIEQNISALKKTREEVEARITRSADTETKRLSARAERKEAVEQIEKMKRELERANAEVSASTRGFMAVPVPAIVSTSNAIEKATTLVKLADKQFEAKEYGVAYNLFRDAFTVVSEAERTLSSTNISEVGKPIPLPATKTLKQIK